MWIVLLLQCISLGLIFTSMYIDNWVKRDAVHVSLVGGLLECVDCDQLNRHLGWDCFAGFMCDIDSDLGYCLMYEDLKEAGRVVRARQYLALTVISGVCVLLWGQGVVFVIQGREYGFASLNYVRGRQMYAACAGMAQTLAIIAWFKVSSASYTADCSEAIDDRSKVPPLCSTSGPSVAIAASALLMLTAAIYIIVFYNRGSSVTREVSLKYTDLRAVELGELRIN
jgi:hypothetical protein